MGKKGIRLRTVVAVMAFLMVASVVSTAAQYKDGVTIGFSDAGRRGYLMAIVTMKDAKIVDVKMTEFDGRATPKGPDYAWPEFHEAMKVLPQRFVDANSVDIDGFAKATGTYDKAVQAVARAMEKALIAKPAGKYQDGTFYGKSADDGKGFGVAWVTIKNDKIVNVEVDEALPDGTWKDWATYPWEEAVEGKTIMEQRFVDANGTDVDLITGATHSAEKYIVAVEAALRSAER